MQHFLIKEDDGVFRTDRADVTIFVAIMDALIFAKETNSPIEFEFNDVVMEADRADDPYSVYHEFTEELSSTDANRSRKATYKRELARQKGILESIEAIDVQLEGTPSFSIVDTDAWQVLIHKNENKFFGNLTLSFVDRWARLMQLRIANGEKLEDIVEETSVQAVHTHISNENYVYAVKILSEHWKYGNRLKAVLQQCLAAA